MEFEMFADGESMRSGRREFVKKLLLAGFALGPGGILRFDAALASPVGQAVLAEGSGSDHARLVRETVGKLGGMGRFVKPGQTVTVKPNIGWDRTPEEAANTNPVVVREVVQMCLDAGAAKVMVFDRTCNDARRCYKNSGIKDAVESFSDRRVALSHVSDLMFEEVEIAGGEAIRRWPLYKPALGSDVLVNLPILKHHGLSRMTAGMKNLMGIMGGNRGSIHREMGQSLVDLNVAVRSHLTIIDATRVLTANGPQGGGTQNVRADNRLCASNDVVAADFWAAGVFGANPMDIPYLKAAVARNFGAWDPSRVKRV